MFGKINSNGVEIRSFSKNFGAAYARLHLSDEGYRQGFTPVLLWANYLVDNDATLKHYNPDQKVAFVGFFCDGYFAEVARYDEEQRRVNAQKATRRTAPGTRVQRMFPQYAR